MTVMVELPEPGAGIVCGLKLTLVPLGIPVADRVTALLKPFLMVVLMAEVAWCPARMVSEGGVAVSVKLGWVGAITVIVIVAVCLIPPPLAVMVMG